MHPSQASGYSLAAALGLLVLTTFIVWLTVCDRHYGKKKGPGEPYDLGDGTDARIPDLPLKGGATRVLKPEFIRALHDLMLVSSRALDKLGIEHWAAGGTLLGFERHNTTIPWDDDADYHLDVQHLEYLFSDKFGDDVKAFGLEAIVVRGASPTRATKEGAAVRLRREGTDMPVLDLFFTERRADGTVQKIDSWDGTGRHYSEKEVWPVDVIYPIRHRDVGNMPRMPVPNQPRAFLEQQYGENAMTMMYARSELISHAFPFIVDVGQFRKLES